METWLFIWTIIEKQVYTEYENHSDVINYAGYECSGQLTVLNEVTNEETIYYDVISGGMTLPLSFTSNFIPLGQVDDNTIFDWLTANGLDKAAIEQQIKNNIGNNI